MMHICRSCSISQLHTCTYILPKEHQPDVVGANPADVPLMAALQSAMLLSRGTRNEVEGWKVRMSRKPCSGFSLYSNSAGDRRKRLFLPPIFPNKFRTCSTAEQCMAGHLYRP